MLCRRGGRRWVRSGEAFTSKYIYKRRSGMQVGWCEDFSLQAKTPEPPPHVLVTHTHTQHIQFPLPHVPHVYIHFTKVDAGR